jgi:outer membrane protein
MYKCISVFFVVVVVGVGFSASTFAQSTEIKIGFVDLQMVIDASEEGQQARAEIKKKADELSQQAKQMKEELEALKADYEQQSLALSEEAKSEKRDAIGRKELDYNRFVKDSRTELQTSEQRALKELLETVGKIVVEYGQQNGYTVILEAGNILYGADSIDLTEEIINAYNTRK